MAATLKVWTSSVYPHEQGRFLGTVTFAKQPTSPSEPITGATGDLRQAVEDGTLKTMHDVQVMMDGHRMQMAWEGVGDFGPNMPHNDQVRPTR